MKKIIDFLIRKFFARFMSEYEKKISHKIVSSAYHNYLMSELSNNQIIPYNIMSISPLAMMYIINHIIINKPKYIVEFGSGISSIFINNLIEKNKLDLTFISVDHDVEWQNLLINQYQLKQVQFIHAEQSELMNFNGSEYLWYEIEPLKIIEKNKVELVIVDAPIVQKAPYVRAGALEFFKSELERDNFLLLFDDTSEPSLKEIVVHYSNFNQIMENFSLVGKCTKFKIDPVLTAK